MKKHGNKLIKQ